MNKIKLLLLESHLSTGGAPQFALKRIQSLINSPEFEIYVVEYSNISDEYVVQKNAIKLLIKPENFITLGDDKSEIIKILKDNKIDIIHIDEITEGFDQKIPESILSELYSNDRTWKIVETCHNVWFNPDISKRYHPDGYAFCTPWHEKTFCNMPSYYEIIQFPIENKVPTKEEKIEARLKLGIDPNKKHIINVGLWTSNKNQKEGIEIARLLENNTDIQFHFIGNQACNFEDYWKPIMNNIPSNVKVWGEREDVDEFMKAADVFMFNSIWECNPLVLKESISHGLKILSRNLPQYMTLYTPFIEDMNDDINESKEKILNILNKEVNYEVIDEFESFSNSYITFYKRILELPIMENSNFVQKPEIILNFVENPFIEIKGESDSKFKIEFFDENNFCHYSEILPINHWIKLNREYYTKWNVKVHENDSLIFDYTLDLKGKRVYISIESRSLGDNLAWFPYVEEFRKKHDCEVIVSTFMNELFVNNYPDIQFVKPGTTVVNLYAMYKIGWFYKDGKYDSYRNPNEFKTQPMQKTASDILGLDYKEIVPLLKIPNVTKMKKVGIGLHSTCQSKYWNNHKGWQEVVNYLTTKGYEVVLYSRENNGYMNNHHPYGIRQFESTSLENLIYDLSSCEFFIGIGSGLSWLTWSLNIPVILISGFSEDYTEMKSGVYRVINKDVCNGCFNKERLDPSDWHWCPYHKGTYRQFECTSQIKANIVIQEIDKIMNYTLAKD